MNLNSQYKKIMFKNISLIKKRNFKLKKNGNKLHYGGTVISDDITSMKKIINYDEAIDRNNILVEEYLSKLNSLHKIITKETPDISKEELEKLKNTKFLDS